MKLDLRAGQKLPEAQRDRLNEIARSIRRPFVDLTNRLAAQHETDIDWWVTPLASRNVFASSLFLRCCQLLLALRAAQSDEGIREIIVETPGLAAVLRRALADGNPAVAVRARRGALRFAGSVAAGMSYRLAAAMFHALNQWLFSRMFRPPSRGTVAAPAIVIDTFVYRDSFENGYHDRHYPGLLDWLSSEERQHVFFLPTFYKIRNYMRLFRALRASSMNFLVKDDYLRAEDYLHALLHPFRLLGFTVPSCEFEGMDIAPIVNEALYEAFAGSGSIEGLLRYRLAERLRDARFPIRSVIDWFENQEIDHGSNAGWRRFLPDVSVTGYQGFVVSPHYLCMFPTCEEMRLRLIPQSVAVPGPAFVSAAREFCPQLEVSVAPAFRFAHLWNEISVPRDNPAFTILVALPLVGDESEEILSVVARATDTEKQQEWIVLVKRHPAMPEWPLGLTAARSGPRLIRVADGFDRLLARSDVLVSAGSSVCIEALARGVPVIIIGSSVGLTFNPIPDFVDPALWMVCQEPDELRSALQKYAVRDAGTIARHKALGSDLRDRLFTRPSRESVAALLMIDGPDRSQNEGHEAAFGSNAH